MHKIGITFMSLGIILILCASVLFVFNQREAHVAGEAASDILSKIRIEVDNQTDRYTEESGFTSSAEITIETGSQADVQTDRYTEESSLAPSAEITAEIGSQADVQTDARTEKSDITPPEVFPTEMAEIEIDGYMFIGYISLPKINIELPVMSQWDYKMLKIAPCRQFGSIYTNDLVIAAHYYKQHFGRINELKIGDSVVFTDVSGKKTTYFVRYTDILQATDVDEVKNSGNDLTLYTCTYDCQERIVVGCDKK